MKKQYVALRTIGTIYKVLGVIAAIFTILAMLGICGTSVFGGTAMERLGRQFGNNSGFGGGMFGGAFGGLIMGVLVLLYGGGLAVTLYALGEGVYLLLALEENTRHTVALLQQPKED